MSAVRIVLTIHHHLARGTGAPGATMALADAYRAAGHEVELLSFDDLPARMPARVRELAFPWACALWLARRPGVDVADVSSGDGWVWARLRRLLRRRVLLACRVHGLAHTFWEAEVREAAESGARLTLLSRAYPGNARLRTIVKRLLRKHGYPPDKQEQATQTVLEAENRRLREENARLRMEREILKKATAFFAKESK